MTSSPRAVSVSLLKGGVGKSTIAINLSERLAAKDHNVLFIDLDPNGHASVGLGFKDVYQEGDDIGDVILDDGDADPSDVILETGFGFDILPSTKRLETVENMLRSSSFPDVRVRQNIVEPLLGDEYDYIVTDSPAYRGKLADNALVATQNLMVPLTPGSESLAGFERTAERQLSPLREQIGLDILAIVPNRLSNRIDQRNDDRELVQSLNEDFTQYVPEFARITEDEFEQIDNGQMRPLPKPGIRERNAVSKSFSEKKPLAHYDPDNDQINHFNTLAEIVINGGTQG